MMRASPNLMINTGNIKYVQPFVINKYSIQSIPNPVVRRPPITPSII